MRRTQLALSTKRASALLGFYAVRSGMKRRRAREEEWLRVPEVFSFIENPVETLAVLERLVAAGRSPRTTEIGFDQRNCREIDLGAEAVASVIGAEAGRRMKKVMRGVYPTDPEQTKVVQAVGLPRALGLSAEDPPDFLVFDLIHGKPPASANERTTVAEDAARALVEYVNRCLGVYGHELTDEGTGGLSELVGEVITNAEDHSDRPEWWVCAYLRQDSTGEWGDCHIAIFNFGLSLAQSLKSLPADAKLRGDIEELVERHRGARAFIRRVWEPDDLWTVYALQGRVSRRNVEEDFVGDFGQGTADMIEVFQRLSSQTHGRPKMCVLSGNTHILFDGRYRMEDRVIAFNDSNDLAERPNPEYVRHLPRRFPGTLISLRFYLDREHLYEHARKGADRRSRLLPFGRR